MAVTTTDDAAAVAEAAEAFLRRRLPADWVAAVDAGDADGLTHARNGLALAGWWRDLADAGYVTPTGTFSPQRLAPVYYSKKYDNAPMPHAIFFYYGFAIHGSYETRHLGHPASHGCVRLAPANAAKLYAMVQNEGATITISGTPPGQAPYAAVADNGGKPGGGFLSFLGF